MRLCEKPIDAPANNKQPTTNIKHQTTNNKQQTFNPMRIKKNTTLSQCQNCKHKAFSAFGYLYCKMDKKLYSHNLLSRSSHCAGQDWNPGLIKRLAIIAKKEQLSIAQDLIADQEKNILLYGKKYAKTLHYAILGLEAEFHMLNYEILCTIFKLK